jgi:predicted membrane protein (TIGR00267 family)
MGKKQVEKTPPQDEKGSASISNRIRSRLRDAVFGIQDGLVSTLGALIGIAEGTRSRTAVVISGIVVIVVESLSMAAGSYLSSKSHRQYLQRLLREEEEAITRDPEGERREIWEMYRARGYPDEEIEIVANRLLSDRRLLLEDMAHKELGIFPAGLEHPGANALVMGIAYLIGGLIPVLPYLFLSMEAALPVSIFGTFTALFLFGGIKGRLVRQTWWRSGLEMVGVAGLAAVAGYAIGRLAHIWIR